ncbi:MAG: DUF58 domain-containing protein [Planctomycetes bacterium]|nr:DUF58 domain-containing protein [Planctomycetota bacterium]MCW8136745.1 DUF58 domain-containing protein [Planctomycetota bacterium]
MADDALFGPSFLRQLEALDAALLRLRGSAGEGLRGRAGTGQSEFKGHRPYARGDDLRRLDWNAYGRLGRLFLREFEPEQSEALTLLVDTSKSMAAGQPPKHILARRAAAAFGFLALKRGGAAGLAGEASVQGVSRFSRLLDQLTALDFAAGAGIGERARALASRRAPRNLIVVTDALEPAESFQPLAALSEKRCRVTLVQVLAPDELDPPQAGPCELFGLEESATLDLDIDASTLAAYRAEMARHFEMLETLALRHGWSFAVTDSAADLRELLLGKLLPAGALP